MLDGFGGLRLRDRPGTCRIGKIAAKVLEFLTIYRRAMTQLVGQCFSPMHALDRLENLRFELRPQTSRPPQSDRQCADHQAARQPQDKGSTLKHRSRSAFSRAGNVDIGEGCRDWQLSV